MRGCGDRRGHCWGWSSGGLRAHGDTEHPRASAKFWDWLQAQPKVPDLGVTDPAEKQEM